MRAPLRLRTLLSASSPSPRRSALSKQTANHISNAQLLPAAHLPPCQDGRDTVHVSVFLLSCVDCNHP